MNRSLLAAALAAVALSSPARADDAKPPPATSVVLVGVGTFTDPAIQPRPTADADAKAFYDLFADAQYLGVPADRITLLTSEADAKRNGQKATRDNIVKALRETVARSGKDDTIIVGVFGRGAPAGDKTGIFAVDSTVKERAKDAVLGSDIGNELKNAKSQKVAFLMDVSFKGFDAGKETLAEPTLRDILAGVFGAGEDREAEQVVHDKLVMLSTVPANDPLTKGGNGLFATVVIDALKGKADAEGYESDGLVTVDELNKYVEKAAADEARKAGKTPKEKETVPYIVGEEFSHFVLTKNPDVTPRTAGRVKAFTAITGLDKAVVEEGTGLLTRMPKLKSQQELRKKYQELADGKIPSDVFATEREKIKAAMKLPAKDAGEFSRKVLIGVELFTVRYIKEVNAGDLTAASIRGLYRRLEEPLPKDLDDQLKAPKELTATKQEKLLQQARDRLGKREDLDDGKDADIALAMLAASLNDPYTVYFDKDTKKKEESRLRAQFSGIGIHIRRDLARDGLLVVAPIKGSPAYKAGLLAGDLIVEVRRDVDPEGKPFKSDADKVISTRGMKTETALEIILGLPGVPVTVVIDRENPDGKTEQKSFTIERGRVSLETVLGVKRNEKDDWEYTIDAENKIGYVYLTQFGPTTYRDLRLVTEKLARLGMKGMVLDLRFNPGGLLGAALMICDMYVESGLLLSVKPRFGREEKHYDQGGPAFTEFPMAVLVNGQSASASEIVSACLQDLGRAKVIGERSYGKGSVQTVQDFDPTGGEFKLTTARYFPPLDRNIDKLSSGGKPEDEWGVLPDKGFEVKVSREERQDLADWIRDKELILRKDLPNKQAKGQPKDAQLDKALDYLREEIKRRKNG